MSSRLAEARQRFRTDLTQQQQRGLRVLAWTSVVCVGGVSLTGIWQFFTHETDPAWDGYVSGSEARLGTSPSEGVADLHGTFATATGVLALMGGAWLAYRVLYDVPWPAVAALGLALWGVVTGSLIRFNVVKLEGREHEDAGNGYVQLFGADLEYVVTDRWELGPMAIRLWTVGHVLTVPILLLVIWLGLGRTDDAQL